MAETPGGKQSPGSKASKKVNDSKFGETIVEEVRSITTPSGNRPRPRRTPHAPRPTPYAYPTQPHAPRPKARTRQSSKIGSRWVPGRRT